MAEVYFDPAYGGDGSTVTDDSDPDTGLANGGHRERFVPALQQTVNVAQYSKSQAETAKVWRDEAENIAQSVADVDVVVKFFATYAAAVAGLGSLVEDNVVEVIADENYDNQRVRYQVQSSALVFQFIVNSFDASNFSYLQQDKSLSYWIRKALVDNGTIPQASPALVYDFADRINSRKGGDAVDLDTDITFTRATSAWGLGANRKLKEFASGEKRYVYDPATGRAQGLLIEEQRTNSFPHSRDLSNAAWTKNNTAATKNATGIDGVASSASTLTDTSAVAAGFIRRSTTITNDSLGHCFSLFVQKQVASSVYGVVSLTLSGGTSKTATVVFSLDDGSVSASSAGVTTSRVADFGAFFRLEVVVTNNSSGNTTLIADTYPGYNTTGTLTAEVALTSSMVVDFVQLELGKLIASSPIETGASAVTRLTDSASSTIGTEFNQGKFTIISEFSAPASFKDFNPVFEYSDGSSANYIRAMFYSDGTLRFQVIAASSSVFTGISAPLPAGSRVRLALKVAENNYGVAVNGVLVASGPGSAAPPTALTTRSIGGAPQSAPSNRLDASVLFINEYSNELSSAELQAVSAL